MKVANLYLLTETQAKTKNIDRKKPRLVFKVCKVFLKHNSD